MKNKCKGFTLEGYPCKRSCYDDNEFCYQHIKIYFHCSICLENKIMATKKTLSCNHNFCYNCITTWESKGKYHCPCCRLPFFSNKIQVKEKLMELMRQIPYEDNKDRVEIIDEIFDILSLPIAKTFIQHPTLKRILKEKLIEFEKTLGNEHKHLIKWREIIQNQS